VRNVEHTLACSQTNKLKYVLLIVDESSLSV
jgi:hypothetical protein